MKLRVIAGVAIIDRQVLRRGDEFETNSPMHERFPEKFELVGFIKEVKKPEEKIPVSMDVRNVIPEVEPKPEGISPVVPEVKEVKKPISKRRGRPARK